MHVPVCVCIYECMIHGHICMCIYINTNIIDIDILLYIYRHVYRQTNMSLYVYACMHI